MTLNEALVELVKRHYRGSRPLLGSVELRIEISGYSGELEKYLELSYREAYRPKRGKVNGKWRYGEPVERERTHELPFDCLMALIDEIVKISAEDSPPAQPPEGPSVE